MGGLAILGNNWGRRISPIFYGNIEGRLQKSRPAVSGVRNSSVQLSPVRDARGIEHCGRYRRTSNARTSSATSADSLRRLSPSWQIALISYRVKYSVRPGDRRRKEWTLGSIIPCTSSRLHPAGARSDCGICRQICSARRCSYHGSLLVRKPSERGGKDSSLTFAKRCIRLFVCCE